MGKVNYNGKMDEKVAEIGWQFNLKEGDRT